MEEAAGKLADLMAEGMRYGGFSAPLSPGGLGRASRVKAK
jgi:hypothetical protein